LRSTIVIDAMTETLNAGSGGKVTVACLMAVGSIGVAEAQQSPLPPVTVDAPVVRKRPPTAKPTAEQIRVRAALRRAARRKQQTVQAPPAPAPAPAVVPADHNPYANPAAPYMATRLAGSKFSQPILNTPRTVTVLTKEILEDKNATSLKEVARTTAGVTLGTGEGGNAFGDRFFIRGFDARNDIFVDGIRDPAVSVRENFFTEQIEILKGPASSFAGRGTTGGALNIVTKQAGDRNFYNADSQLGTDGTKRITLDVNQVVSPVLSFRLDGMWQNADVAERNYVFDDRWGGLAAVKWTPNDDFKVTANYFHTDLNQLPDFGVPYNTIARLPITETGVPRETFYGFVNRDFQKVTQDLGTINAEYYVNDWVTLNSKFRAEKAVLNYIGTIPEQPNLTNPNPLLWTVNLNPQSRYQVTDVLANQTDATFKFMTGPVHNTVVAGIEVSRERVSLDTYTGLASEAIGSGAFTGSGSLQNVPIFYPPNLLPFSTKPTVTGNPTIIPVDTKAAYLIETANYKDFIILNGGIRYDDYDVSAWKALTPGTVVSTDNGMFNYNAGITVKPVSYGSFYAAYATSSNPVGAELDGTSANYGGLNPNTAINQIFAPQTSKAEEVGTKWELFDRRLLATAALFHTEVDNARELIPSGFPNAGTIQAGAAYRVQGIDLGATGKITDRWSVYTGLVLMNTKVTESSVPSNIGLPLAFIANQSFNVLTKYQITDTIQVGGQATYRSHIYGGTLLAANQGTVLPDYWRFDAFVEGKINANFSWKVFVNNIFDKTYYDAFYQSAAPFVFIAPGRAAYLQLSAKF
jgi:catecholate siderophore receptor